MQRLSGTDPAQCCELTGTSTSKNVTLQSRSSRRALAVEFHILLLNVYRQEQQGKQTEIENQIVSSVHLKRF